MRKKANLITTVHPNTTPREAEFPTILYSISIRIAIHQRLSSTYVSVIVEE